MKPQIQRFPAALLPLLSIKASETPQVFDEQVAASLEMLPFYAADRLEVTGGQSLAVTTPLQAITTVPQGEYWYLYALSASCNNITAGSNVRLACGVVDQSSNAVRLGAMASTVVSAAGDAFSVPGTVGPPLILKPGMGVFAETLIDPGAGTLDLYCRALIARFSPGN